MANCIQFITGINEGLRVVLAEGVERTIGRSANNDLVLGNDAWVSGAHAVVKQQNHRFYLKDLSSTNGTYLAGSLIPPNSYREINDLFVVGSTIFQITEMPGTTQLGPCHLDDRYQKALAEQPVFRGALNLLGTESILSSWQVVQAFIEHYGTQLEPFFKGLGLSGPELLAQIHGKNLFLGQHAWLNHFLNMPSKPMASNHKFITPLGQTLATLRPADPLAMMKAYLEQGFSLLYPLLNWSVNEARWGSLLNRFLTPKEPIPSPLLRSVSETNPQPVIKSEAAPARPKKNQVEVTLPPYLRPLLGLSDFWEHLAESVARKALVLITGVDGSGKTAALQLGMKHHFKRDLPPSLNGYVDYFDPKAYFFFYSSQKLPQYMAHLLDSIGGRNLTVVDHFDMLVDHLKASKYDVNKLFQAIAKTAFPPILVVGTKSLEVIYQGLKTCELIDFGLYQPRVVAQVIDHLMEEFQEKVQAMVSPKGKRFFVDKIVPMDPYNIRMFHEVVQLSVQRATRMNMELAHLEEETTALENLGEQCFREVYQFWLEREYGPSLAPETSLDASADQSTGHGQLLEQLETLFHNFAKTTFKTPLTYSDRTQNLKQKGRLSYEQKLEEFKLQVVHLVTAFQGTFPAWFEEFWLKLDPEMIQSEVGDSNVKKLWQSYLERTRNIDGEYAEDLFHSAGERMLREARSQR